MSKKKQVTFADIAEYTNFSKTTISRYFNHPDSLTLENQEKISQALDTLGYKKNKLAKVLANGKSEFIGIIVPNLYLHYYSEMLTQFLSSYRDYHYKFLVFVSEHGAEEEQQYIEELLSYQPANKKSRLNLRTLKILYRLKIWYQNKTTTPVLV